MKQAYVPAGVVNIVSVKATLATEQNGSTNCRNLFNGGPVNIMLLITFHVISVIAAIENVRIVFMCVYDVIVHQTEIVSNIGMTFFGEKKGYNK
jgi:hypothetical protein